jgi:hypothetical protein
MCVSVNVRYSETAVDASEPPASNIFCRAMYAKRRLVPFCGTDRVREHGQHDPLHARTAGKQRGSGDDEGYMAGMSRYLVGKTHTQRSAVVLTSASTWARQIMHVQTSTAAPIHGAVLHPSRQQSRSNARMHSAIQFSCGRSDWETAAAMRCSGRTGQRRSHPSRKTASL